MGAVYGLLGPDEAPQGAQPRSFVIRVYYRFTWWVLWVLNQLVWRMSSKGADKLPKKAPFLLLPNHSAGLDPFWVGSQMSRHCSFMAASTLLASPVAGPLLAGLGAFPKQKFVKDSSSMAEMERRYHNGEVMVLFPEGDRTWDGGLNLVPPGIGRLIKRMRPNVVYARMVTAHLTTPRWSAGGLRWIPNYIEYDGPYTFSEDTSAEEIVAHVIEHITTTPKRDATRLAWGRGLARGLPELLWACPVCWAIDGLDVAPDDHNRMVCQNCGAAWRVDLDHVLNGEAGQPTLSLREARERMAHHFGDPPVPNRENFEATGVVMQDSEGILQFMERGKPPVEAGRGQLRLTATRLSLIDGDGGERWGMGLLELDAFTIEISHQIYLRTSGKQWRLDIPARTRLRWALVTSAWHMHVKPPR